MTSEHLSQARPDPRAGLRPSRARDGGLLLAAVLLAGLNMRGAIGAVSPVLPQMRAELGLSPTVAGLVTTLPVLCFAVLAPPAAWLGRRMGAEAAVCAGLLAIAAGTVLRALDGAPLLLVGTSVIGAGMTLGNVLLPAVTKREFAERAGTVTGLYTAALCAGAALTAALTAPLAGLTGWRTALAAWAALAVASAALWAVATRGRGSGPRAAAEPGTAPAAAPAPAVPVWRSSVAWAIATVLALQSVLYYAITAWLPTLLLDELGQGLRPGAVAAALFQVLGIPGSLLVPAVLARRRQAAGQSGLGLLVAASWAVLVLGLLVAPGLWVVWAVVGGLTQGAGIAFAFTVLVLRAADDAAARRLSGMAQLVGYSVGATGPLLVGAVYAATGGWAAPLVLLLGVAAVHAGAAVLAGRPRTVG
ncbi:MFS transporter [Geodermatophilus sp. SYSU D00708]